MMIKGVRYIEQYQPKNILDKNQILVINKYTKKSIINLINN